MIRFFKANGGALDFNPHLIPMVQHESGMMLFITVFGTPIIFSDSDNGSAMGTLEDGRNLYHLMFPDHQLPVIPVLEPTPIADPPLEPEIQPDDGTTEVSVNILKMVN